MAPPPPSVTAFLGRIPKSNTTHSRGDIIVLWNYLLRKIMVVEAIGFDSPPVEIGEVYVRRTYMWAEEMQNIIHTVDFKTKNFWAYLIDSPSGGRRLIQRPPEKCRPPPDFLWAQRIDLSEIEITSLWFKPWGYGRGLWRGTEYDIHLAFVEPHVKSMEKETKAFKALRGLDLTYEVIAHIFVGDVLVGLMTESSSSSRCIKSSDRAVVFAALAKLERAFMVHRDLLDDQRLVIDAKGQVRLIDIQNLVQFSPNQRKELEEQAQECHWDTLRSIFESLTITGFSSVELIWYETSSSITLAKTPSPEQLLSVAFPDYDISYPGCSIQTDRDKPWKKRHKLGPARRQKASTVRQSPLTPSTPMQAKCRALHGWEDQTPPPRYTLSPPPYAMIELPFPVSSASEENRDGDYAKASIVELE
ncbi:hypothetical protein R3P38DRAFT_1358304 [Favolaschia claudopus]|uniref:Uncharacterized protein n=1 Tax=Favolaschia claudopus TaxID=2862362 RepID=A0AAW0DX61_9AGAR